MVSTPHPVSLPKMPLISKQWPQWDCRAPSVQHIFKASLVQHIIDQTKAELNASSVGFVSPQPAGVEAVTGVSGDLPIPFDFALVASFLLTSLPWEIHYQGHVAPQAGSTTVLRKGGWPGLFQLFISLPAWQKNFSLPAIAGCLNTDFLQREVFYRCTLSCGRTVQVTTTF